MTEPNHARSDRRWVQHLIEEERTPAVWLLIVAVTSLTAAQFVSAERIDALLHTGSGFLPLDLQHLVTEGLLVVFFYVAGLELRHELTHGSLASWRAAAVPVLAAIAGMVVPAAIFATSAPAEVRGAWGVAMATDLPLALALLGAVGRALPTEFRAFLLSLAIVDDVLSILVIAFVFGTQLNLVWLLAAAGSVLLYARLISRNGWMAGTVALLGWAAMVNSGIHPTVFGAALGLATAHRTDALRERWQPWSAYVAVPAFVAVSLALPLQAADIDARLVGALSAARIIGKPLGIGLGAALGIALWKPARALPLRFYFGAGSVAALGFSVSLLFADLALPRNVLPPMTVAIVTALVLAAVVAVLAMRPLRKWGAGR